MELSNPKVSICIPAYEMHGMGVTYLRELLDSVLKQSYSNIEVVISDHSKNDDIVKMVMEILPSFIKRRIQILYYRLRQSYGNSSANMNNAIKNANGVIIKPMFQDDLFNSNDCIIEIVQNIIKNPEAKWGGVGFNHIDGNSKEKHREMTPEDNNLLLSGNNTFGCPTVVFFKKCELLFDENLIWLMDCEFYHNLREKFGKPLIVGHIGVTVRVWEQSVSKEISDETKTKEEEYVLKKYNHTKETLAQTQI